MVHTHCQILCRVEIDKKLGNKEYHTGWLEINFNPYFISMHKECSSTTNTCEQ